MGPLLGLDVGDVRVGVAIAPADVRLAVPHGTYLRARGEAEEQILKLIQDHGVECLVVGLPLGRDGEHNPQCAKVENFCRRLKRRKDIRIEFVDEHLSSVNAREALGARKNDRSLRESGVVDATAACLILQSYLDSLSQ